MSSSWPILGFSFRSLPSACKMNIQLFIIFALFIASILNLGQALKLTNSLIEVLNNQHAPPPNKHQAKSKLIKYSPLLQDLLSGNESNMVKSYTKSPFKEDKQSPDKLAALHRSLHRFAYDSILGSSKKSQRENDRRLQNCEKLINSQSKQSFVVTPAPIQTGSGAIHFDDEDDNEKLFDDSSNQGSVNETITTDNLLLIFDNKNWTKPETDLFSNMTKIPLSDSEDDNSENQLVDNIVRSSPVENVTLRYQPQVYTTLDSRLTSDNLEARKSPISLDAQEQSQQADNNKTSRNEDEAKSGPQSYSFNEYIVANQDGYSGYNTNPFGDSSAQTNLLPSDYLFETSNVISDRNSNPFLSDESMRRKVSSNRTTTGSLTSNGNWSNGIKTNKPIVFTNGVKVQSSMVLIDNSTVQADEQRRQQSSAATIDKRHLMNNESNSTVAAGEPLPATTKFVGAGEIIEAPLRKQSVRIRLPLQSIVMMNSANSGDNKREEASSSIKKRLELPTMPAMLRIGQSASSAGIRVTADNLTKPLIINSRGLITAAKRNNSSLLHNATAAMFSTIPTKDHQLSPIAQKIPFPPGSFNVQTNQELAPERPTFLKKPLIVSETIWKDQQQQLQQPNYNAIVFNQNHSNHVAIAAANKFKGPTYLQQKPVAKFNLSSSLYDSDASHFNGNESALALTGNDIANLVPQQQSSFFNDRNFTQLPPPLNNNNSLSFQHNPPYKQQLLEELQQATSLPPTMEQATNSINHNHHHHHNKNSGIYGNKRTTPMTMIVQSPSTRRPTTAPAPYKSRQKPANSSSSSYDSYNLLPSSSTTIMDTLPYSSSAADSSSTPPYEHTQASDSLIQQNRPTISQSLNSLQQPQTNYTAKPASKIKHKLQTLLAGKGKFAVHRNGSTTTTAAPAIHSNQPSPAPLLSSTVASNVVSLLAQKLNFMSLVKPHQALSGHDSQSGGTSIGPMGSFNSLFGFRVNPNANKFVKQKVNPFITGSAHSSNINRRTAGVGSLLFSGFIYGLSVLPALMALTGINPLSELTASASSSTSTAVANKKSSSPAKPSLSNVPSASSSAYAFLVPLITAAAESLEEPEPSAAQHPDEMGPPKSAPIGHPLKSLYAPPPTIIEPNAIESDVHPMIDELATHGDFKVPASRFHRDIHHQPPSAAQVWQAALSNLQSEQSMKRPFVDQLDSGSSSDNKYLSAAVKKLKSSASQQQFEELGNSPAISLESTLFATSAAPTRNQQLQRHFQDFGHGDERKKASSFPTLPTLNSNNNRYSSANSISASPVRNYKLSPIGNDVNGNNNNHNSNVDDVGGHKYSALLSRLRQQQQENQQNFHINNQVQSNSNANNNNALFGGKDILTSIEDETMLLSNYVADDKTLAQKEQRRRRTPTINQNDNHYQSNGYKLTGGDSALFNLQTNNRPIQISSSIAANSFAAESPSSLISSSPSNDFMDLPRTTRQWRAITPPPATGNFKLNSANSNGSSSKLPKMTKPNQKEINKRKSVKRTLRPNKTSKRKQGALSTTTTSTSKPYSRSDRASKQPASDDGESELLLSHSMAMGTKILNEPIVK